MLYGTAESGGAVHTPNRPPRMSYAKHPVRWAPNGTGAPVQDVSVDLGRAHVVVTEKLLDSPDVVAVFQAGGEGVAKRVAAHPPGDARAKGGGPHRALKDRLVKVVAAVLAGQPVDIDACRREHPLPGPFAPRVGIFPGEGPRQLDPPCARLEVDFMLAADRFEVTREIEFDGNRQHRQAVLVPFPGAHDDLVAREIEILHTQARALEQAKPRAIE